jgi:outer membrane biosynthesis protein TonB
MAPVCATVGDPNYPPGYFEFQVDVPVRRVKTASSSTSPHGRVLMQFVVDTSGRPVEESIKVLQTTGPDVVAAASEIIRGSVYEPALRGGCRVNQVVHQPFTFG